MPSTKLEAAIKRLHNHYHNTVSHSELNNHCLRYTRKALEDVGLAIPHVGKAKDSGYILVKNPAKFGWVRVSNNLPRYTLDFYDGVGIVDGITYGHVGIVDRKINKIVSAVDFNLTEHFKKHRFASFIPKGEAMVGVEDFEELWEEGADFEIGSESTGDVILPSGLIIPNDSVEFERILSLQKLDE